MHVCLKLFCTISNFQKIPAEIILGHEHVFVCIWPANGEAVCAEDLAVKCVWCVCERLLRWCFSCVFFLMWQKLQHSQCLAACEDCSDVWLSKRCAPMMVAEIQQCLAPVLCCWICIRIKQKDDRFISIKADCFVVVFFFKMWLLVSYNVYSHNCVRIVILAVRSDAVLVSRQTVKAACGLGAQDSLTHALGWSQATIPGYNGLIMAHTLWQTEDNPITNNSHWSHQNTQLDSGNHHKNRQSHFNL